MKKFPSGNYHCKFYDKGCRIGSKSGELTRHVNSCDYNPDLRSICTMLFNPCTFKPGCFSKAEVISHFEIEHQLPLQQTSGGSWCFLPPVTFLTDLLRKQGSIPTQSCILYGFTGCKSLLEHPLFLLVGQRNEISQSVSLACVLVWFYDVLYKFNVEFSLERASSSLPFPFNMKTKVWTMQEAQLVLKTGSLGIPISMLEETQFGAQSGDKLLARITVDSLAEGVCVRGSLPSSSSA